MTIRRCLLLLTFAAILTAAAVLVGSIARYQHESDVALVRKSDLVIQGMMRTEVEDLMAGQPEVGGRPSGRLRSGYAPESTRIWETRRVTVVVHFDPDGRVITSWTYRRPSLHDRIRQRLGW
jgi:hypothetical protein